jgi:hypothetical protein
LTAAQLRHAGHFRRTDPFGFDLGHLAHRVGGGKDHGHLASASKDRSAGSAALLRTMLPQPSLTSIVDPDKIAGAGNAGADGFSCSVGLPFHWTTRSGIGQ